VLSRRAPLPPAASCERFAQHPEDGGIRGCRVIVHLKLTPSCCRRIVGLVEWLVRWTAHPTSQQPLGGSLEARTMTQQPRTHPTTRFGEAFATCGSGAQVDNTFVFRRQRARPVREDANGRFEIKLLNRPCAQINYSLGVRIGAQGCASRRLCFCLL